MVDYLYDGSFEGLLTCIYHHYYRDRASGIFHEKSYQQTMLGGFFKVDTDREKAARVYEAIEKKISPYDLRRVYKAFLCEEENKEYMILQYVVMGFKVGSSISMLHGNPVVFAVQAMEKKINVEKERMLQFVRFSVLSNNVLYAEIEPDHDVTELIAEHFCDRYKNDPFIIRDVKRNKALVAYQKKWYITDFSEKELPALSDDERQYQRLWKQYFENIAIMERKNSRCQRNFMPQRYWKHLTEMKG